MSYSVTISGHIAAPDEEEGRRREQQLIDRVSELVASLDGATYAHGTFQYAGSQKFDTSPAEMGYQA